MIVYRADLLVYFPVTMHPLILSLISYPDSPLPLGFHSPFTLRVCQVSTYVIQTNTSSGSFAFIGLGVYSYFSGQSQLKAQEAKILKSKSMFGMKSRQTGITGIALTLVGMGLWRLKN